MVLRITVRSIELDSFLGGTSADPVSGGLVAELALKGVPHLGAPLASRASTKEIGRGT